MTRMRRVLCSALAALPLGALAALPLFADDAPPAGDPASPTIAAPETPARPPVSQIEGTAPVETPQERMERFKRERGAGSDKPFEGFAKQAELEMQRQREAAIGSATLAGELAAEQTVEDFSREVEKLQDQLGALATSWGGTPCMEQEPDWAAQDDWIRYRRLSREDYLSEQPAKLGLTVGTQQGTAAGYLALIFSCVVTPSVVQEGGGGAFIASLAAVRYFALLSRNNSYLVADARDYALQHEQLHFQLAHQFARWLNKHHDAIRSKMTRRGRSRDEALGLLQLEFGKHMLAVQRDARALETAYDSETQHGLDSEAQTQWNFRIQDGLEAMAKGVKLETRAAAK